VAEIDPAIIATLFIASAHIRSQLLHQDGEMLWLRWNSGLQH
jgi:hypothetical protein